MRFLTPNQGNDWLATGELPGPEDSLPSWAYAQEAEYRIPGDAGRKTALARLLASPAHEQGAGGMLWITACGIWPSSENQELFYALRRALGEQRPLSEVPCHLFDHADAIHLECLLDLVLYFSWDAILYVPSAAMIFRLSHDEMLELYSNSVSEFIDVSEKLRRFGLEDV